MRSARTISAALALAIVLAICGGASAQDQRVAAGFTDDSLYVGDTVLFVVRVSGGKPRSVVPEFPDVPGLQFAEVATSNRTSVMNGRVSTELGFVVRGMSEGEHEVPEFTVRVDGKPHQFGGGTLSVVRPKEDPRLDMMVEVEPTSVYPHQPVLVTYKLLLDAEAGLDRIYSWSIPILDRHEELDMTLAGSRNRRSRTVEITLNDNVRASAEETRESWRGRRYRVFTIRLRLYPQSPGVLHLPPASIQADVAVGPPRREGGIFGRIVRDRRRMFAATDAVRIEVKPVPEEGRPDAYTGLVGRFSLSVSAEPTHVKVGDPIRLTMTVRGDGLLSRAERPDLESIPGFEAFKVDENLAPGSVEGDEIVFEQLVRARSEEVGEIPSIPLAYFNPELGRFEVSRSDPIPLEVEPTRIVSADDVQGPAGSLPPVVEKQELEQKLGGINANYAYRDALVDQRVRLRPLVLPLLSPVVYVFLALGVRVVRRSRGDEARQRARGAKRRARARLDAARAQLDDSDREFFEAASLAIHRYLVDRFGLGEGEVTEVEVSRLEREGRLPGELASAGRALLERCDAGRFGTSSADRSEREAFLGEIDAWFGRVERER